ncbi:hypothetical protein, partial [Pseudomonas quasicaspiana]|uniref:hypothetical protein n=1 Tax=Pseudomonas quasicaspiana TaxID=2829821 RepID=UPI001E2873E6
PAMACGQATHFSLTHRIAGKRAPTGKIKLNQLLIIFNQGKFIREQAGEFRTADFPDKSAPISAP